MKVFFHISGLFTPENLPTSVKKDFCTCKFLSFPQRNSNLHCCDISDTIGCTGRIALDHLATYAIYNIIKNSLVMDFLVRVSRDVLRVDGIFIYCRHIRVYCKESWIQPHQKYKKC